MATISITKLEVARNNPKQFADQLKSEVKENRGFRTSAFADWQRAAFHFHDTQNENSAIIHLTDSFKRHFVDNKRNTDKLEEHISKLESYIQDAKQKNLYYNDRRKKIFLSLNSKVLITGLVPLIYLNADLGYSAFFFQKANNDWQNELKFPVVQNFIATKLYGCDITTVEVGVYSFESNEHYKTCYSNREIKSAIAELNNLGTTLASYI